MKYGPFWKKCLPTSKKYPQVTGFDRSVPDFGVVPNVDDPEGKPPETAEKRRDPPPGEGLGLGLSLVKRICAHQGWSVSMRSPASGGSCFEVTLG